MRHSLQRLCLGLALPLGMLPLGSNAESYPTRSVRIINPYPTGLSPDIASRMLAEQLGKQLQQSFVVENRPGANGFIALNALKGATADGYTIGLVGDAHMVTNPKLIKETPYDPLGDFDAISMFFKAPLFFYTAPQGGINTVNDLIKKAKADPKAVTYGTPYVGSPAHMAGALFAHASQTEMLSVHYKEAAQIYTAVANGDLTFSVATVGSGIPLVKAGKMQMIAAAAKERHPDYPDIPTVQEATGLQQTEVDTWVGIVAPKGTPADVINTLNREIAKALQNPELLSRFKTLGLLPYTSSAQAMRSVIEEESSATESRLNLLKISLQ